MPLRHARAYTHRHAVAYTRTSKKKNRSYIKVVPPHPITKFNMGKTKLIGKNKFPYKLAMVCAEKWIQMRPNAVEASRQFINKQMEINLAGNYILRTPLFPHHIQRENKMLTGAGADRMSTGMQLSFGKCISRAILFKEGKVIFEAELATPKAVQLTRSYYKKVKAKLPCKTNIILQEIKVQ